MTDYSDYEDLMEHGREYRELVRELAQCGTKFTEHRIHKDVKNIIRKARKLVNGEV